MSDSSPRSYYAYTPSLAAAIIFAVLYTLAFVATVIQWIRYRAWVWIVMVVAAFSAWSPGSHIYVGLDCESVITDTACPYSGGIRLHCKICLGSEHRQSWAVHRPILSDCPGASSDGSCILCYICMSFMYPRMLWNIYVFGRLTVLYAGPDRLPCSATNR